MKVWYDKHIYISLSFMSENPENTMNEVDCWNNISFHDGILTIPEGLQNQISQIHAETSELQKEYLRNVINNYIRSNIPISSWNEILDRLIGNEIFMVLITWINESHFTLESIDIMEGRWEIFRVAIQKFHDNFPEQYEIYLNTWNHQILFWNQRYPWEPFLTSMSSQWVEETTIEEVNFWTEVENILWIAIHGREDVNSVEVLGKIDFLLSSNSDFTHTDAEKLLTDAFTLAFEREMQWIMQEQMIYMWENYDTWREAFSQRLTQISDRHLQEMLLFLPFVESNLNPRAVSQSGARGMWQLTLATAQRNSGWFDINVEDLYNPLVSTKLAARYLNQIIGNLKHDFPLLSEQEIVSIALREYNGAWSSRLKPQYRQNIFETVMWINLEIDLIQAVFEDSRMSEVAKLTEMMQYVERIENTYFDNHGLSEYISENNLAETPQSLFEWSQDYLRKIVLQQLMYPYQVIGAYNAYSNLKNTQAL